MENKIDALKKDGIYFIAAFLAVTVIFKIVFYNEPILSILRLVASIYWLFVIPGTLISYLIFEELVFVERFVIGILMGAVLVAIPAYYLGLLGVDIRYSIFILPAAYMIISLGFMFFFKKK